MKNDFARKCYTIYRKQNDIDNKRNFEEINAYQAIFILYDKSKFLFSNVDIYILKEK